MSYPEKLRELGTATEETLELVREAVTQLASQDGRGLMANRPLANSVPPGSTWWAVDRLGQNDEVTVSDGTNWNEL